MRPPLFALLALASLGCAPKPSPPAPDPMAALGVAMDAAIRRIEDSIALIQADARGDESTGATGQKTVFTGLVISADGKVLVPMGLDTSRIRNLTVRIRGQEYPAVYVKADGRVRCSVIQASGAAFPAAAFASRPPGRGDWLVALTASGEGAEAQVLTSLKLVRGRRFQDDADRLLLGGALLSGSRAGGDLPPGTVLADLEGKAVGMVHPKEPDRALAFDDVAWRLERLLQPKEVGEPAGGFEATLQPSWLGLFYEPLNEDYAEATGLFAAALRVTEILPGSPAQRAGMLAGDCIVGVNGEPIPRRGRLAMAAFYKRLKFESDREVAVQVVRGIERYEVTCRFEKTPVGYGDFPQEVRAEDLGLQVKDVTPMVYATSPDLMFRDGVLVTEVVPGSPAGTSEELGKALIEKGQLILELDGRPTPTVKAFTAALESLRRRRASTALVRVRWGTTTHYEAMNLRKASGDAAEEEASGDGKETEGGENEAP